MCITFALLIKWSFIECRIKWKWAHNFYFTLSLSIGSMDRSSLLIANIIIIIQLYALLHYACAPVLVCVCLRIRVYLIWMATANDRSKWLWSAFKRFILMKWKHLIVWQRHSIGCATACDSFQAINVHVHRVVKCIFSSANSVVWHKFRVAVRGCLWFCHHSVCVCVTSGCRCEHIFFLLWKSFLSHLPCLNLVIFPSQTVTSIRNEFMQWFHLLSFHSQPTSHFTAFVHHCLWRRMVMVVPVWCVCAISTESWAQFDWKAWKAINKCRLNCFYERWKGNREPNAPFQSREPSNKC